MQVNLSKTDNRAVLEIEVPPDDVEQAMDRAYRKIVRRVNVPGFRKGRAPRGILERFVGTGPLLQEALDLLLPESYRKAVQESGIEPIDGPNMEIEDFAPGKALKFKATVEVKPEVTLGDYRSVRESMEMKVSEVTDGDVDRQVELLRERQAKLIVDEDGRVSAGSFVVVDFSGTVDGKPYPKEKVEGLALEVGSNTMLPGFEEQLVGARAGEEREVRLTIPGDHRDGEVAGREAAFRVVVREVKKKELPELGDEFAREAGGFQNLQELRSELKNRLKTLAEAQARNDFEARVVEAVVNQAVVDLPQSLVTRETDLLLTELKDGVASRGMTWDAYLGARGKTEAEVRGELEGDARAIVKRSLTLDAVAGSEGIEAEEPEIQAEAARMARAYGQPAEAMEKFLRTGDNLARVRAGIVRRKTIQLLAYGSPQTEEGIGR